MTALVTHGDLDRLLRTPAPLGVDGVIRLHATDSAEYVDLAFRDGVLEGHQGGHTSATSGPADLVIHGPKASVRRILLGESTVLEETRNLIIEGELWALMSLPHLLQRGETLMSRAARASLENHMTSEIWSLLQEHRAPCQGFQLYVGTMRSELSIAAGATFGPRPMTTDVMHHVRCATKPLLALAALALEGGGHLDLDMPLRLLTGFPSLASATGTLRDVLCHDAGLPSPRLAEAWFAADRAGALLDEACQTHPLEQYSEVAGWHVLDRHMRHETGESPESLIDRLVLEPLGIDGISVCSDVDPGAVGTYFAARDGESDVVIPLLMDLSPRVRRSINAAWGGVASAQGLGRLYRALLRPNAPEVASLVGAATSYRRGTVFDPVLRRPADFSAGFMVDLAGHGYGSRVSDQAFGYTGWMGSSWGMADPARGICCAFIHNGFCTSEVNDRVRSGVLDIVSDTFASDAR